ncbi:MAG: DUF3795 domain-containing protein [Spirochaetes bacterium]|nr:DUF3795 domain-containing protein [Spirochaetota bacterium]
MLAACGNRCDLCPRYIATRHGAAAELRRVAELWRDMGWRDSVVPPEEISCSGCDGSAFCRYGIRSCAGARGVADCGLCGDYPCAVILEAFSRTSRYEGICRERCGGGDFAQLKRAFFEKRRNLEGAGRGMG